VARGLVQRLRRLERHVASRRWCVVRIGYEWEGDVRVALGLDLGANDMLVVVSDFAAPDAPPRLVSLAPAG
jgi:hypothetical protein